MDFSGTGRARAGGSGRDPLELELCLWGRRQADSTVRGIGMGMGGRCCVLLRMASAPRHLATCLLSPSFLVSSWTYYCTSRSAAVAAERAELAGRRIGAVGRLPGRSARRGASASTLAWPLAATAPGSSRFAQSQVTCATLNNKEKKVVTCARFGLSSTHHHPSVAAYGKCQPYRDKKNASHIVAVSYAQPSALSSIPVGRN